jgi:hypothetical protein
MPTSCIIPLPYPLLALLFSLQVALPCYPPQPENFPFLPIFPPVLKPLLSLMTSRLVHSSPWLNSVMTTVLLSSPSIMSRSSKVIKSSSLVVACPMVSGQSPSLLRLIKSMASFGLTRPNMICLPWLPCSVHPPTGNPSWSPHHIPRSDNQPHLKTSSCQHCHYSWPPRSRSPAPPLHQTPCFPSRLCRL